MNSSIWATLGLDPTTAEREIRRAYARRLKVVHPEDDPEGFRELREAYEHLTSGKSAHSALAPPPDPIGVKTRVRAPRAVPPPPTAAPSEIDDILGDMAFGEAHEPELRGLKDALWRCLLDPGSSDALRVAALSNLLASPGMTSIRLYDEMEDWVSRLTALNTPRADMLIDPASDHFGWDKPRLDGKAGRGAAALLRRSASRQISLWSDPASANHRAFQALARSPGGRMVRYRLTPGLKAGVAGLLAKSRSNKILLDAFDPEAVSWWSRQTRRTGLPAWFGPSTLAAPFILATVAAICADQWTRVSAFWAVLAISAIVIGFCWIVFATIERMRTS